MPALRSSTLKQGTNSKTQNVLVRTPPVRRKTARRLGSSLLLNHGLGALSHLPYELRQIIFEQLVPSETPPAPIAATLETGKKVTGGKNPQHAADTCTGLVALLCTSKAISTEVKRSYQNREYQLSLSTFGIAFEGIRNTVEFKCCCNYMLDRRERRCDHCTKGLMWNAPNSKHNRPLSLCRALKCLKGILPAMRQLHVVLTNDTSKPWVVWRYQIRKICEAGSVWDLVRKAELAGVELRVMLELPKVVPGWGDAFRQLELPHDDDVAGWVGDSKFCRVVPLRYESKTTVKRADPPHNHRDASGLSTSAVRLHPLFSSLRPIYRTLST